MHARPRSGRIPARATPRAGYAKEFLRQQFPRRVRRRPSARLGGAHDVRAGAAGDRRSARSRERAAPVRTTRAAGGAGRDRSARPATSWRWSAGATSAQSQFNRASRSRRQPGSAFKPLLFAAALEHGYSPVSVLDGPRRHIAPQGPDEWAPRNADGETPDALTLRAALLESNNRAATRAAAAGRVASGAAARVATSGCATCPTCRRCRSAPAW